MSPDSQAKDARQTADEAIDDFIQRESAPGVSKGRREPTFDGDPEKTVHMSFKSVREVVELSRRLALEDYFRHVHALSTATTEAERLAAVEQLVESEKATRLADGAFRALMAAEGEHRGVTLHMAKGDGHAAHVAAQSSGEHLDKVADGLNRFSEYPTRSVFFQSAIDAVVKADILAGKLEAGASKKVAEVADGIRAFSKRCSDLGTAVRLMPKMVMAIAAETKVTVAQATARTYAGFVDSAQGFFKRMANKAQSAVQPYTDTAWKHIDAARQFAAEVKDGASYAADRVDLNARATVGLAGSLLSRMGEKAGQVAQSVVSGVANAGDTIKSGFDEARAQVEGERAQRRSKPR